MHFSIVSTHRNSGLPNELPIFKSGAGGLLGFASLDQGGPMLPYLAVVLAAFVEHPIPPSARIGGFVEINEILCDTPRYAMDFAAAVARGEASELAKDTIGKRAQRAVCGRFIGLAVTEKPSVATADGVVYQLVAYRFKEDNRIGWLAEPSFAPGSSNNEVPL